MSWLDKYRPRVKKVQPIPAGMHVLRSSTRPPFRLHLRLEEDGHGILIINASTILHLNPTAAEYVYHLVHETPEDELIKEIRSRYRVQKQTILNDLSELSGLIDRLIYAPNSNPDNIFDLEHRLLNTSELSAPYRLNCSLKDTGPMTNRASLALEEWMILLDKAWEAGIPHILFIGNEQGDFRLLIKLIRHCQENGQVAGLVTQGGEIATTEHLYELLKAGLDHFVLVMPEDGPYDWQILARLTYWMETLEEPLNSVVHFTLNDLNEQVILRGLDRIGEYGVTAVSLTATDVSLTDSLLALREHVDQLLLNLVWALPVPYEGNDPITLEILRDGGEPPHKNFSAIFVGSNGEVRNTRYSEQVLGNLLTDPWEAIWAKARASENTLL